MTDQNNNDQFPNDLNQAIHSIASLEAPTDIVQRLIADSCKMASTQTENDAAKLVSRKQFYVLLVSCLVAFLTPMTLQLLGSNLGFLPGWEQPAFRGAFTGLASICLCFLTWSFGQHLLQVAPQRKSASSRVRRGAQIAAFILCGWLFSGLFTGQGNLYAQLRETMANISTIQCVTTMLDTETGEPSLTTRYFIRDPGLMRMEQNFEEAGLSNVFVTDFEQQRCLTIDNDAKTAEFLPMYQIEEMRKAWNETDNFLRGVNPNAKLVGERTVGGRKCQDFEVRKDGTTTIVSIDRATSLPVQMKMTVDEYPQFCSVLDKFVFDEPIDPELFSFDVPEDYTVTEVERKEAVDDSDLELVPGERMGSATFGMTMDQVIEQLGDPDQISEFADTLLMEFKEPEPSATELGMLKVCTLSYASRGFSLRVEKELGLFAVHCEGQSFSERVFAGQIAGGIRMGDSREVIRQKIGKPPRKFKPLLGEQSTDLIYELENGATIRFAFENAKLEFVNTYKTD